MPDDTTPARCGAAHPDDPRPCDTQQDAVRVLDQTGTEVAACIRHGAMLVASLVDGRVYPLHGPAGSAIRCYVESRKLRPFEVSKS